MDETFSTFDTLGVDAYSPGSPEVKPAALPVIGRLPALAEPGVGERTKRFDTPSARLSGSHAPVDSPAEIGVRAMPVGDDPIATIRIDTVAPYEAPPRPAQQADPSMLDPAGDDATADLSAWLLKAEATVLPYSRWIVLAAVLAAIGLTLVLLRGDTRPGAAPPSAPVDESLLERGRLAAAPVAPLVVEGSFAWPEGSPAEAGEADYLRPIASAEVAQAAEASGAPRLSAAGPPSARAGGELPHAELSGLVLAPHAGPEASPEPVEVASRPIPAAYPSTSAAGPYPASSGSLIR